MASGRIMNFEDSGVDVDAAWSSEVTRNFLRNSAFRGAVFGFVFSLPTWVMSITVLNYTLLA